MIYSKEGKKGLSSSTIKEPNHTDERKLNCVTRRSTALAGMLLVHHLSELQTGCMKQETFLFIFIFPVVPRRLYR
jgi:hypothetical protein